jgi:hypothetical protein
MGEKKKSNQKKYDVPAFNFLNDNRGYLSAKKW